MGRQPRPVADGLLYHALNRGNNRHAVFFGSDDFETFLHSLRQTQLRYPFFLFAYCLMNNHFHLLLQPENGQSISRIMQSLTVAHTWHYHRAYQSVGHVWQGRFRSPVIQDDGHALTVMRYIEANPLRAGMVTDLADWSWSSYGAHGLGKPNPMLTVLPCWETLGATEPQRQQFWRRWVHQPLSEHELAALRRAVTSGRPFGEAAWVARTIGQLRLRFSERRRGRPRKQPSADKIN
jgi:putative transposase